jgi:NAD(P)-dependent dehydrogenase (short-subunit alcohol dehydrogenase family)
MSSTFIPSLATDRRAFLQAGITMAGAAVTAAAGVTARADTPTAAAAATGGRADPAGLFAGMVVLITGATSGIGEATARAFVMEGAKVFFNGRREALGREVERTLRGLGGEASYFKSDVRIESQLRDFVAATHDRHGRIDAVFLNAGTDKPPQRIAETALDAFDDQLATNLRGVFLGMKYTLPHLAASKGALVATASIGGRHAFQNIAGYGASKAAVIHLVRSAAQEYGRDVRVNAVAPGPIESPMLERVRQQWNVTTAQLAAAYPMQRVGTAAEVAQTVLWLCGEQASYVSGQIIGIDGGDLP